MSIPTGFSTGCFYQTDWTLGAKIALGKLLGADAVELSFATEEQLDEFEFNERIKRHVSFFKFISVHAPWLEISYDRGTAKRISRKILEKFGDFSLNSVVLHPTNEMDFKYFNDHELPFAIENMDNRKDNYRDPESIRQVLEKNKKIGAVLDLQHLYEYDRDVWKFLPYFLDAMAGRLTHLHVSGCAPEKLHVPVYQAKNYWGIERALDRVRDKPRILEGVISKSIIYIARMEMESMKKFR